MQTKNQALLEKMLNLGFLGKSYFYCAKREKCKILTYKFEILNQNYEWVKSSQIFWNKEVLLSDADTIMYKDNI